MAAQFGRVRFQAVYCRFALCHRDCHADFSTDLFLVGHPYYAVRASESGQDRSHGYRYPSRDSIGGLWGVGHGIRGALVRPDCRELGNPIQRLQHSCRGNRVVYHGDSLYFEYSDGIVQVLEWIQM